MPEVIAHLLPDLDPRLVRGGVAVVIDVLRATTTIVTALAHGARCVVPCAEVSTAHDIAHRQTCSQVLLGGERGGEKIPGFDLDNSPGNYLPAIVEGKTVVFTTSHGTQAIGWASEAAELLIGSFLNLSAVVRRLAEIRRPVHLVCSGTDGQACIEDTLCAAAIAGSLWESCGRPAWQDDAALLLLEMYRTRAWDADDELLRLLASGRGGRRLTRLGFQRDIAFAAQRNVVDLVPQQVRDESGITLRAAKRGG